MVDLWLSVSDNDGVVIKITFTDFLNLGKKLLNSYSLNTILQLHDLRPIKLDGPSCQSDMPPYHMKCVRNEGLSERNQTYSGAHCGKKRK